MRKYARLGTAWLFLLFFAVPDAARAQGQTVSSPVELARKADALRPGEWVWAEAIAPSGPVLVYVDVARQTAAVYRNGVRVAVTTVSTGKPGHATPTGVFTILEKNVRHRSKTYNNAPMPYQQRLTWDGVALHAGGLPGYPESHGCVHLPMAFARKLFATTNMGGTVIVSGTAGQVETAREASVLAFARGAAEEHAPLTSDQDWRWQPERSRVGPLSLIVSRTDQRVVVLRNGVEIGRARIAMPRLDEDTRVYAFSGQVDGAWLWTVAGLPGHADGGAPVQPWLRENIGIPDAFLTRVRSILAPGATILITSAGILPGTSGRRMTVVASAR